jgi:Transposase DDE domain
METMSEKVISIYCFMDDFLKEIAHNQEYCNRKCSDSIILTTAIVSARYFYGNQSSAMLYMQEKQGVKMLEKSAFNRRLHQLAATLEVLFYYLADFFKHLNLSQEYVIDSFPVAVCDNIRIRRSNLVKGEEYRGKIASKRRYFYGFRVQVVVTKTGQPVQFFILPGSYVDVTALQMMHLHLPEGSEVYADSGYNDYEQEDIYAEVEKIELKVQRKSNSKRPDKPYEAAYKKMIRQKIEQVFSQITARFPKKIHAITEKGFLIKIVLFLLAYAMEK